RSIPTPFRSSSSNALYRPNRNSGGTAGNPNINAGQPLDYGLSPSPISQDFAAAVAETAYSPSGSHQGFNMTLDFGLHGDVHVLTGNGTNMGSVPFAAGDPVFYTHHCNIDRIWASWNNAGRANPTSSSWLNKTFIFADEHCNKVIGKIDDFKSIVPLNYTYDSFVRIPGGRVLNLGNLKFLAVQEGITIPNPPDPYHIAIPLNDEATSRLKLQTRSLVGSSSEVRLVLRNLTAKESPEVLYAVYVGLPAGSRTVPKGAKPVGYVNFFESAMPGMAMNEPQNRFHSFDVTEALRGAKMAGTERSLNVTLQPLGRPKAGAAPTIGRMELVATE
ncbi:MAG: tyrosinase family protein, partial [Alphaproteobacteria bacterium]|nr:tyrosinase family protein [Alphaproteobacteria bacterium]